MIKKENSVDILEISKEISTQLSSEEVRRALLITTFKGLSEANMRSAITEGVIRGFKFKDFLEKNVYAIPFSSGYSLVTSIDYARKVGMRSGVCGKSAPSFTMANDKIESCSVTIKRLFEGTVGEYTATVFFDEYNTGKQQWAAKPRTMIAKVAEMHALRMACPEEMSQIYTEEEMVEDVIQIAEISEEVESKITNAKTEEELKAVWEEHKGLGKAFAKMVVARKQEIKNEVA